MFESRKTSEEQAQSYHQIQNRMNASSLSDLLDARKDVRTRKELENLSKTYAIDLPILEALGKVVNTPSVGERTTIRSVENGEERVTSKVGMNNRKSRTVNADIIDLGSVGEPKDRIAGPSSIIASRKRKIIGIPRTLDRQQPEDLALSITETSVNRALNHKSEKNSYTRYVNRHHCPLLLELPVRVLPVPTLCPPCA
jgi:hypothetical protein